MSKVLSLMVNNFNPEDPKAKGYARDMEFAYENTQIKNSVNRGRYREQFIWEDKYDTMEQDVSVELGRHKPDILHFSCTGENSHFYISDNQGTNKRDGVWLAAELKKQGRDKGIKLLVLRVPGAEQIAREIVSSTGVGVVLYMKRKETAEKCEEFLTAFYELLADGMSVSQAYNLSKCAASSRAFELMRGKRNSAQAAFAEADEHVEFATIFATEANNINAALVWEIDDSKAEATNIRIQTRYPKSRREIIMNIAYDRPEMVHFTSHANHHVIALEDGRGNSMQLEKFWLVKVMKEFRHMVRIVLLNSCLNYSIAFRVSEYIEYVVGAAESINGVIGSVFAINLYGRINAGMPYRSALRGMISNIQNRYFYDGGYRFKLFEKKDYQAKRSQMNQEEVQLEENMLEAKEAFLERYGTVRDFNIECFEALFESWFTQFRDDSFVQKTVMKFLQMFCYYSKEEADKIITGLAQEMLRREEEDCQFTVFCPLPSKDRRFNSSYEYWPKFNELVKRNKYHFQADIESHNVEEGKHELAKEFSKVKVFTFMDDFIGTGENIIRYLEERRAMFKGKKIYFLVVHAMEAGKREVERRAKKLGLQVTILAEHTSKKAFQLYQIKPGKRNQFIEYCKGIGMDPAKILGKDNMQALVGFYNTIPAEDLGIFCGRDVNFMPLFRRREAEKPEFIVEAEKDVFQEQGLTQLEEQILYFYQKLEYEPGTERLCQMLQVDEEKVSLALEGLVEKGLLKACGYSFRPANPRKIVVMRGEFNPPVNDDIEIMRSAMEEHGAQYGIFVLAGEPALVKKAKISASKMKTLSEELRTNLVKAIVEEEAYLLISRCELGEEGDVSDTLANIQYENPNAELILLEAPDHVSDFDVLEALLRGEDMSEVLPQNVSEILRAEFGMDAE